MVMMMMVVVVLLRSSIDLGFPLNETCQCYGLYKLESHLWDGEWGGLQGQVSVDSYIWPLAMARSIDQRLIDRII